MDQVYTDLQDSETSGNGLFPTDKANQSIHTPGVLDKAPAL